MASALSVVVVEAAGRAMVVVVVVVETEGGDIVMCRACRLIVYDGCCKVSADYD